MNRLFNTNYNHHSLDIVLLILRLGIAGLLLTHGIPKLNTLIAGGAIQFPDPLGVGQTISLVLTVFAEVICSIFLLLGFALRLFVLPLIFTMLVIVFIVHGADGIGEKESAIHYLLAYIVLLFAGAGNISVDALIGRKATRTRRGY